MREGTFYLVLAIAAGVAFYYGIPQKLLGDFAHFVSQFGQSIGYRI